MKHKHLFPLLSFMFVLAAIMALVQSSYQLEIWHVHWAVAGYITINALHGLVKKHFGWQRLVELLAVSVIVEILSVAYLI